jgi:hypothetical protein
MESRLNNMISFSDSELWEINAGRVERLGRCGLRARVTVKTGVAKTIQKA